MTAVQFLREIVGFTGSGGAAHIVKVHPRKNEAHDDEPAGSLSHHGKPLPCRNDLDVEQRSRRKEFTDQPDESQGKRKTDSHAQTVHRGIQHRVFRRERFGTPEHDAVHDDQRNEDSERIVKTLRISLHQKIHNRHESCNHHNIAGNADLCRDNIADRGYHDVAAKQDKGRGKPHPHAVDGIGGGRQRRAHAEDQHQNGILFPDPLQKFFGKFHFTFSFLIAGARSSALCSRNAEAARHARSVTARELRVAPLT